MLYTVKGANPHLTPYLLMAHLDVVPANPSKWDVPPFDAEIKDNFVYARGTIDFKQGVMVCICYFVNISFGVTNQRLIKDPSK